MGFQYRRRRSLGGGQHLNVSGSRRGAGVSVSQRVGPLTLNSRGRGSLRVAPGLSFRFGKRNSGASALIMLGIYLAIVFVQVLFVVLQAAFVLLVWLARWWYFSTQSLLDRRRERKAAGAAPPAIES